MRPLRDRLSDILEASLKIEARAAQGREKFFAEEDSQVWALHHITIIGEAVRASLNELRDRAPSVPWREIIAMRNIIVHAYFGIDLKRVWAAITVDIPVVRRTVMRLIDEMDNTK